MFCIFEKKFKNSKLPPFLASEIFVETWKGLYPMGQKFCRNLTSKFLLFDKMFSKSTPISLSIVLYVYFMSLYFQFCVLHFLSKLQQEGQRCPKRRVAQVAIRLATAVIQFRNKERNVRSPS